MARLIFINYHFHATFKKVQACDIDKYLGAYTFMKETVLAIKMSTSNSIMHVDMVEGLPGLPHPHSQWAQNAVIIGKKDTLKEHFCMSGSIFLA